MTQEHSRIEINLVPLELFSESASEGWMMVPGNPVQMSQDYSSRPNFGFEEHLMAFSVTPRETAAPLGGQVLQFKQSAFTLYVTGQLFGLSLYSFELVRLLEDFDELCPSEYSRTVH
ncbi:hypothetical protein SJ05684_b41840 (plasmid) [Sinorhizobium sojae CCBAU 05684]|uniref:Uncharacterized protein n=1 Tax=Sinorhizobium sojae CCBAU 05684 TaxID=716928 RepID=A0A249PH99_9HYPH|nr:hypothetical protein [Sinorhizobium sojae]ASY65166.1 hypothetical protein SJ05684_b41840 [Sinorhizobium sojae CCBAU 05684]